MVTATQKLVLCCVTSPRLPGSGAHNAPFNYSSVAFFTSLTISFLTTLPDGGGGSNVCNTCSRRCLVPKVACGRGEKGAGAPEPSEPAAGALGCDHVLQRGEGAAAGGRLEWKEESRDEALTTHYILSVR